MRSAARPSRRTFLVGAAAAASTTALGSTEAFASGGSSDSTGRAAAWETVLGPESLADYAAFEAKWNYLYPWGSDHNGTARMYGSPTDHNHISLSGGELTLKATRISWDEGNSESDPFLPIHYHSGAVHAKDQVVVSAEFPEYEVKGEFQAPSTPGTWPAFWLTGVNSWPPESDILEFKGSTQNWFNTFRTSDDVSTTQVTVSSPGDWHSYRAWITKISDTDVDIHYYLDDVWQAVHTAPFVDQPMWLICNLQMEGSSGDQGPEGDTYYRARNFYIGRTRA